MGSNCSFSNRISAYHDGELDAEEDADMERHLRQCPQCATELAEISSLSALFTENEPPRLSQIARHRLHKNADGLMAQRAEADVIRVVRVLRAVAACVVVVGSIWLLQSPPTNSSQELPQAQVPPWLEVAVTATAQTTQLDTTTPAAAWYLADFSSRSDD